MHFKSILIADLQDKTAYHTSFSKGINVVTSDDNHVGKSSLIKALFHSIGADCSYDGSWNLPTKLFISWIEIEGHEYVLARHNKRFCVLDNGKILLTTQQVGKQLAPLLEEMFAFRISSLDKNTKLHRPDPMLLYLPYYIDQDLGWGSEPFVSFSNINQFAKKDRLSSLYSHLGCDEERFSLLEDEKATINSELKGIIAERESMKQLLSLLNNELTDYIFDEANVTKTQTNLNDLFNRIDPLMKRANEYRIEIQKTQADLTHYKRELEVVREYAKVQTRHAKKNGPQLRITCPNCGYEYGETIADSIREAYGTHGQDYVQQQIQYLMTETQRKIESLSADRAGLLQQIEEEKARITAKSNSTEDYIRSLGLKSTIDDIEQKYDSKLLEERNRNERKEEIARELRKRAGMRKKLDEKYSDNLQQEMSSLGIWSPDFEGNIGIMKPATIQGSAGSKAVLADYLSFFRTRSKVDNPGPDIPFVVDSPRTKEASDLSSKQILKSIKAIDGLVPQIIVATTEFNRLNEDLKWKNINTVFLSRKKRLLIHDIYEKHQKTIEAFNSILKMAE